MASITDVDYDEAKLGLASKLYKYIGGENVDSKYIYYVSAASRGLSRASRQKVQSVTPWA